MHVAPISGAVAADEHADRRAEPRQPVAIARPSPALAPVTSTTFPSSRGSGAHAATAREVADVAVAEQRAIEDGVQRRVVTMRRWMLT